MLLSKLIVLSQFFANGPHCDKSDYLDPAITDAPAAITKGFYPNLVQCFWSAEDYYEYTSVGVEESVQWIVQWRQTDRGWAYLNLESDTGVKGEYVHKHNYSMLRVDTENAETIELYTEAWFDIQVSYDMWLRERACPAKFAGNLSLDTAVEIALCKNSNASFYLTIADGATSEFSMISLWHERSPVITQVRLCAL